MVKQIHDSEFHGIRALANADSIVSKSKPARENVRAIEVVDLPARVRRLASVHNCVSVVAATRADFPAIESGTPSPLRRACSNSGEIILRSINLAARLVAYVLSSTQPAAHI